MGNDVPVSALLSHLKANGWSTDPAPHVHTSNSQKCFGDCDYVARRGYLQCLVCFPELLRRGLQSLRSRGAPQYYSDILQAEEPEQINLGIAPKSMGSALKRDIAQPEQDIVGSEESEPVIVSARSSKRRRQRGQSLIPGQSPSSASKVAAATAGGTHVAHGQDIGQVSDAANARTDDQLANVHEERSSSQSSGALSSAALQSDTDSGLEVTGPVHSAAQYQFVPSPYMMRYDEHGTPGNPGHYRRLCIKCPLANTGHEHTLTCQRYRNLGHSQSSQFGHREPEMYLLAWADAAQACPTRAQHMKYKPCQEDIRRALRKYCSVPAAGGSFQATG